VKKVQSESDFMPARASLSASLSLFNFTHLWFRFQTLQKRIFMSW